MQTVIDSARFAPAQVPALKSDDRPARLAGFAILVLTFGGFGVWAALAPLSSAAVAPGLVTVESYRKTIQHLEGGIVEAIRVRDGDTVAAGAVLLRLDATQARAQLEIVRGQYLAARALEARLIAERDRRDEIAFPEELQSQTGDGRIEEALAGQRQVFAARGEARRGEVEVLEQRIEQFQEQIRGLEAVAASKAERIASYSAEVADLKKLFDRGLGDKLRLREMERARAELEGERAEHLSSIAATRVQIGETRLQILQVQQRFQAEVVAELGDTQATLVDLRERLTALRDTVERTEIRAPVAGTVVGLNVHTIGGVIERGEKLLDIVPQGEPFVVEAQVQPTDIDQVYPGLEADLRFSSFNASTTPVVTGTVRTVSADRLTDPASDKPYYLARIQVDPEGMVALEGLTLLPGMPAEVMIKTGERTFLAYLLKPLTDRVVRAFREE